MIEIFGVVGLLALVGFALIGIETVRRTQQEPRLSDDDPLIDVLHQALANRTGTLRVSDAFLICGIEPGKVNQDQISRFGKAIRELGWERQRLDGTRQYAYVRGTAAERGVKLVVEYDPHMRSVRIEVDKSTLTGAPPDVADVVEPGRQSTQPRDSGRVANQKSAPPSADVDSNAHASVTDYLDSLVWDGTPRLDRWLIDCAGADDTSQVREASRKTLIAAVRRARYPGCHFDQMLILEGPQGCGKSTLLRELAVKEAWFTDDLPLRGYTRRLMEATAGKWIVEVSELKGMGKGDVSALKAYLSRRQDEARLAYDHKNTRVLRQFVLIGTTNETAGYFRDETGNRRCWPVSVKSFDLHRLRADRDQLWAEASEAEALGESIRPDPSLYEAAVPPVNEDSRDHPEGP